MTTVLLAIGFVFLLEGLVLALAPSRLEEALRLLSTLPPETVRAARIIAVALRDYGWFITDTAGAATFQFEANVTAGDRKSVV